MWKIFAFHTINFILSETRDVHGDFFRSLLAMAVCYPVVIHHRSSTRFSLHSENQMLSVNVTQFAGSFRERVTKL